MESVPSFQNHLSLSQKSRKTNHLQFPQQGPLWRVFPVSRTICLSLKSPGKRITSNFPNRGPYGECSLFPEPSVSLLKVPENESPLISPTGAPMESVPSFQSHLFLSQKSRKTNHLQFPQQGPLWRVFPVSRAICFSLKSPGKRITSNFPNRGPYGECSLFPEPSVSSSFIQTL